MYELKKCPFCGDKAEFEVICNQFSSNKVGFNFCIRCQGCKISRSKRNYELTFSLSKNGAISFISDDRMAAAADWNERSEEE